MVYAGKFTNHEVIIATDPGEFKSVTPSTAGFVLTSNGTSADPSFQAIPAPAFTPNSTIQLSDDFIGVQTTGTTFAPSTILSNYGWCSTTTHFAIANATTDAGHPGILGWLSNATGGSLRLANSTAFNYPMFVLGGGVIVMNFVIQINTLSDVTNRYTFQVGFGDTSAADQVNGCYFQYSDNLNSGNWVLTTAKASTRTSTNTAVAVATGWHNFQVTINAAASSVNFTLDGVSLGNIVTNIPIAAVSPVVNMVVSAGTIPDDTIVVDLFYLTQTLTNAR
jgi:hypothetical protein